MNAAAATLSPELPWVAIPEDERRFRRLVLTVVGVFLFFSILMPFLPLPESTQRKAVELPPRVAQLILQRQQQTPPPPKVAKIEPKKPEKKKPEPKKPKPEVKKPEKKPEPKKPTAEQVRKKAASSGILAFSDQLADLRDLSSVANVTKKKKLTVASNQSTSAKKVAAPTRSIVTSSAGASQGSGGINTSTLSTNTGGTQLATRTTSRVEAPISTQGATSSNAKQRNASRSAEEITDVIDKNKSALFRIYNRELRSDPTLKGKVVLEITIAPSGKVLSVKLVSSELASPGLERKLVARIKLINFGAKEVETVTTTLPIDFFPA